MSRSATGVYTLPVAAFLPGGVIKSSDHNDNYSDIATALTQSLATTGVSSMTGPVKAAAGSSAAPSYAFASDTATGLYLSGSHQISMTHNGSVKTVFASDGGVTVAGDLTAAGDLTVAGAATVAGDPVTAFPSGTVMLFRQAAAPTGWTKVTTYNNYALRIVSGTPSSGGTVAFSDLFNASVTNLAQHNHGVTDPGHNHTKTDTNVGGGTNGAATWYGNTNPTRYTSTETTGISINNSGSGATTTFAVKYVDAVFCQKD